MHRHHAFLLMFVYLEKIWIDPGRVGKPGKSWGTSGCETVGFHRLSPLDLGEFRDVKDG